jgi:phage baseplate assembly protein W
MKGLAITEEAVYIAQDNDLIQRDLNRLLFMRLEDAIGQLDIGSRIPDMQDNEISAATAKTIIDEATLVISLFEPRIEVDSIAVNMDSGNSENYDGEKEWTMVFIMTFHKTDSPGVFEDLIISKVYVI